MKRRFFVLLFTVLLSLGAYSETVGTWAKVFGKAGNDVFTNAAGLDDGGFILTGYTTSRADSENTWVVNIDCSGAMRWEKIFDLGGADRAVAIAKLSDGSLYVGGKMEAYGNDAGYILKLKNTGSYSLTNHFAFTSPTSVKSIHLDGSTAYSVGLSSSDSFIEKGDNVISSKIISSVQFYDFVMDPAGGFIAVGEKDGKPVVVKLGADLSFKSAFLLSGGSSLDEGRIVDIIKLTSGSFVLAGEFDTSGISKSIFICKLDSSLVPVWLNSLEQREESTVRGLSATSGGDILLAGTFRPSAGDPFDGYASLWGQDGGMVWQKRYGGDLSDELWAAISSPKGGFLLVGKTKSYGAGGEDGFVIRTDDAGDVDDSCDFVKTASLAVTSPTPHANPATLNQSTMTPSLNPGTSGEKDPQGSADLLCYNGPQVFSVTKKGDPFRLTLNGANFRKAFSIFIGDSSTAWAKTAYIDGTKVSLKGGTALKNLFPKGTPVLIRIFNEDGRGSEIMYTR
jgi:hypothetical protein